MDSLDDILDEFAEKTGIKPDVDAAKLEQNWESIVGEELADKLSVQQFEHGRLSLKACNPSWSQQASLLREDIKRSINAEFDYDIVDSIHVIN